MHYTLSDVTTFCHKHRKVRGFKGFSYNEIAEAVIWAADNGKLIFVADSKGIIGVCIYTIVRPVFKIYIHHIVAIRDGFSTLVSHCKDNFEHYSIAGSRNGKLVTFNNAKLWQILHKV